MLCLRLTDGQNCVEDRAFIFIQNSMSRRLFFLCFCTLSVLLFSPPPSRLEDHKYFSSFYIIYQKRCLFKTLRFFFFPSLFIFLSPPSNFISDFFLFMNVLERHCPIMPSKDATRKTGEMEGNFITESWNERKTWRI
mgnify:CR=1 FL=1